MVVYPPNVKYVDLFRSIQKKAQDQKVGMWSQPSALEQTPAPASQPKTSAGQQPSNQVVYKNCAEVRAAGKAPLHIGDPGYSKKLDRDGDGIACE